ncbi:MAG: type I phosphomannose isomerase catalytic subunit [Phycisphaerae bacterium]
MTHLLTFTEIYKERIWGGRNFKRVFGKRLPENVSIGESWELADLPENKSVVDIGPAAGKNIAELVKEWKSKLLGSAGLDGGQFPLLIKFLDANDILSVQVHPDYESAARLGGSVRAKYEAWYVVDAEKDAYVYVGFKPGIDIDDVNRAVTEGTLADLLVKLPARKGDLFYIPGGTVHAIGSGLVIAEVQTPSDSTFRLHDWNRIDVKTAKPRELHIEQALQCIRFDITSELPAIAPTFRITKNIRPTGDSISLPVGQPLAWVMIDGAGVMTDGTVSINLKPGKVVLIPAGVAKATADFTSQSIYLEVTLE